MMYLNTSFGLAPAGGVYPLAVIVDPEAKRARAGSCGAEKQERENRGI